MNTMNTRVVVSAPFLKRDVLVKAGRTTKVKDVKAMVENIVGQHAASAKAECPKIVSMSLKENDGTLLLLSDSALISGDVLDPGAKRLHLVADTESLFDGGNPVVPLQKLNTKVAVQQKKRKRSRKSQADSVDEEWEKARKANALLPKKKPSKLKYEGGTWKYVSGNPGPASVAKNSSELLTLVEKIDAFESPLHVGDAVKARFGGSGRKWYPGHVSRDHGDLHYDVLYEDGDHDDYLPRKAIFRKSAAAPRGPLQITIKKPPKIFASAIPEAIQHQLL